MTFDVAHPEVLALGAATTVLLALLFLINERRRRRALRAFAAASPESSLSPRRRWFRHGLALAGVAMAFIALARPRAGYRWEQEAHRGVDLVFAVDTSRSMRAADLRPDRLTRAKLAVADLVRKFENERVGLIAFAGGAFVQAPMTVDHDIFLEALDALDTDIIPRPGSDLSSAIRAATQAMVSEPDNRKVLVLVSDGEDLAGSAVDAAREAARAGVTIYTVGVGSQRGELLQIARDDGTTELVRDETGAPVRSRLDETTLRAIAQVSGGAYEALGADGRGLEMLYDRTLAQLPTSTGSTMRKVYSERFQIPLGIALACLLIELLIREHKRARVRRSYVLGRLGTTSLAALALLLVPAVAAAAPTSEGAGAYNRGTETYRAGDYEAAEKQFANALHTPDVELQVDAYYNLGNARYRVGEKALEANRDQAIAAWKQAIAAYEAALALAPGDEDATFNRDLVARKLAALENEQQQQQNHDQQGQGKQQQNQDQQGQGKQQQNQDQQGQGKQQQGQRQQQNQGQQGGQGQQQQNQGQQQQQDQQGGQQQQQQNQGQQGPGQQQNRAPQGNDPQKQAQKGQGPQDQEQATQGQAQQQPTPPMQASAPDPAKPDSQDRGKAGADKPAQHERAASKGEQTAGTAIAREAAERDAAARAAADAQRRAEGKLTHTEAVQLLDSVEDELRALPIDGSERAGLPADQHVKDW